MGGFRLKKVIPMIHKPEYLTKGGLVKLEAELKHLREVKRPEVAGSIQRAKELGGTVNNAEYEDVKNEQAFVEGRILTLENILKNATIIQESPPSEVVRVGSHVVLVDNQGKKAQYIIVGSAEVNPKEGKISHESPVGMALLGKKKDDEVEVQAPGGLRKLRVVGIR